MAATVARESRAAPSVFATLLQRSKFASYDPTIAQVYTTSKGAAHRGDWGLKRPLTKTKTKGNFRTIKSVDSREQQTEWYNAEQPARWIRSVEELDRKPVVNDGPWLEVLGMQQHATFDSDYNMVPTSGPYGPNILGRSPGNVWRSSVANRLYASHIPNTEAMHPKHFEKYLEQLRHDRPKFKEMLFKEARSRAKRDLPVVQTHEILHLARNNESVAGRFMRQRGMVTFDKWWGSTKLYPSPHNLAGLAYPQLSNLTSRFLHDPVPGRLLSDSSQERNLRMRTFDRMAVGVGGMIGSVTVDEASGHRQVKLTDTGHDRPFQVRVKKLALNRAPQIMNVEDGKGHYTATLSLEVMHDDYVRSSLSNSYRPGSQKYIAHYDQALERNTVAAPMKAPSQRKKVVKKLDEKKAVNILTDMIGRLQ